MGLSKRTAAIGLLVALAGLVGCNQVPRQEYDALQLQYNQLSDQNTDLGQQLRDAETREAEYLARITDAEQRAAMSQEEASRLRQQLSQRPEPKVITEAPDGWEIIRGGAQITVGTDLLFDPGKATLTQAGQKKVAEIAKTILQEYPDATVLVYGHTDSDPIKVSNWKDNLELSGQRAMAVTRVLRAGRIPAKQILTVAMGEGHPVAANETAAGKAKNRRVVIRVWK